MIRSALETAADLPRKTALLPAGIEIHIAAGDLDTAERLCNDMNEIADIFGTTILARIADQGRGSLALARGAFADGVTALTRARLFWSDFRSPYLVAKIGVEIARGCAELGDKESATMELDAAEKLFRELQAEPDLVQIKRLRSRSKKAGSDILTPREREVLALMADGISNRAIAEKLGVSPKTVNRHVENILGKLGAGTRTAAVAMAIKTCRSSKPRRARKSWHFSPLLLASAACKRSS